MRRGYIKLFRKFFEHKYWKKKRKYSEAEAWIDLIQMARWKDEPVTLFDDRGEYVLEFGDVHASLRFLGKRWGWSTKKGNTLLTQLLSDGSIKYKIRNSVRTIIHINKLRTYMEWGNAEGNTEETLRKHSGNTEVDKEEDFKPVKPVKPEKTVKDIGGKKKPPPNPEVALFIDYAYKSFNIKTGSKMCVDGKKDGALIKALLRTYELEELKELWDAFIATTDEFIKKAGFSIGVFKSQINKLVTVRSLPRSKLSAKGQANVELLERMKKEGKYDA